MVLLQEATIQKFTGDGNTGPATVTGLDFAFAMDGSTNVVSDQYDAVPVPALGTVTTPPTDGFFCEAPYRGAFDPNKKSWMSDWTFLAFLEAEGITSPTSGLAPCLTDINFDRITNNADFLILLGKFNQSLRLRDRS